MRIEMEKLRISVREWIQHQNTHSNQVECWLLTVLAQNINSDWHWEYWFSGPWVGARLLVVLTIQFSPYSVLWFVPLAYNWLNVCSLHFNVDRPRMAGWMAFHDGLVIHLRAIQFDFHSKFHDWTGTLWVHTIDALTRHTHTQEYSNVRVILHANVQVWSNTTNHCVPLNVPFKKQTLHTPRARHDGEKKNNTESGPESI